MSKKLKQSCGKPGKTGKAAAILDVRLQKMFSDGSCHLYCCRSSFCAARAKVPKPRTHCAVSVLWCAQRTFVSFAPPSKIGCWAVPQDPPASGRGCRLGDASSEKIPSPILMGEGEGEGNFIACGRAKDHEPLRGERSASYWLRRSRAGTKVIDWPEAQLTSTARGSPIGRPPPTRQT